MNVKKLICTAAAAALAAAAFAGLGLTASAAGYTRTLTEELAVTGYKAKAFYDFQTNDPAVLPTEGDLRYRDGGIWGLHNFGSGGRSAAVSISVAAEDILVLQHYSSETAASIDCGALDQAFASSTNFEVYDITSDADSITFTVPRGGGIVAALVMERDTSVAIANYTMNYLDGQGAAIKPPETKIGIVGSYLAVNKNSITADGQKYIYVSDNAEGKSIASDGSTVINITYRPAEIISYSAYSNPAGFSVSGTGVEGDTVYVGYPRYINVEGTLYSTAETNREFRVPLVLDAAREEVITYNATDITGVVFYAEGEDVDTLTAIDGNHILIRGSKGAAGTATGETPAVVTTLPAGSYKIYGRIANTASSGDGNTVVALGGTVINTLTTKNQNTNDFSSGEVAVTIDEATDLTFISDNANYGLDYIYAVRISDETKKYTVTLVDGENQTNTEVEENGTFTLPTPEARLGMRFDGWRLLKFGGDEVIEQGGTEITVTADVEYEAVWRPVLAPSKYTVTLIDAEGADPITAQLSAGETFTFPAPAERLGVNFDGWKTEDSDELKQAGDTITVTGSVTYTSQWSEVVAPLDPAVVYSNSAVFVNEGSAFAKTFIANVTAGTFTISSIKWTASNSEGKSADSEAIEVNLAKDTTVVVGLVVESSVNDAEYLNGISAVVVPQFAESDS